MLHIITYVAIGLAVAAVVTHDQDKIDKAQFIALVFGWLPLLALELLARGME